MPIWLKSDDTDPIDKSAVKFEIDRAGFNGKKILCSSVNFKNAETKANAWTIDTVYNPFNGGEKETSS